MYKITESLEWARGEGRGAGICVAFDKPSFIFYLKKTKPVCREKAIKRKIGFTTILPQVSYKYHDKTLIKNYAK